MTREYYLQCRQTNTYGLDMMYEFYTENKPAAYRLLPFAEFAQQFNAFLIASGRPFIDFLPKVIDFFDAKHHICILFDPSGNKILKIY